MHNFTVSDNRRREALYVWKSGLGKRATYRALIEAFIRAGQVAYADAVAETLSEQEDTADLACLESGTCVAYTN